MREAHRGECEAEILLRDVGWMRALCRQLVRDADAAEDVAQSTWLAALETSWPLRGPSRAWLAHVARNFARLRGRGEDRRRARERDAHDIGARDARSPLDLVARVETQRLLSGAVLGLDEPYRATILLRYVEGLDPAEIARRTNVPAATVRSRTARGLEQLRMELDRRSQGDRTRWLASLAPLARASESILHVAAGIGGVVIVKSFLWIGAVVLVAIGWLWWPRASGPMQAESTAHTSRATADSARGSPESTATPIEPHAPDVGRAPVVANASKIEGAHLALRILDASTHEAVPDLALTVSTAVDTERLESDADGIVRCARIDADAAVTLDLSRSADPSDMIQIDRKAAEAIALKVEVPSSTDASDAVREIEVPVGPTYFLGTPLPGGLAATSFVARLSSANPDQAFDRMFATLHADARPWMRFSPKARAMHAGPPWKIRVGSVDGLWSGECEVESNVGTRATPLTVEFVNTGCVRGRVTTSKGDPAAREIVAVGVPLTPPNNHRLMVVSSGVTDADGRFEARWIPPGSYTVHVQLDRAEYTHPIDVSAGVPQTLDITMPPQPRSGDLQVRLTSETGTYGGKVLVLAHSLGESHRLVSDHVAWDGEGSDRRGRAELRELEPCDQRIELVAEDGTPVRPAQLTARADGRTVDVVVLDRTPMRALAFEVRDAASDEAVEPDTLRVSVAGNGPDDPLPTVVDKASLRSHLPVAAVYTVEMLAHGYKPFRADVEAPPVGAPIVLHARKGWGAQVHTVDDADHDLANVRIVLDGHDCGTTDARGKLDAELDGEPTELKAQLDGWRTSEKGDVDPTSGRFRAWLPWVRVVLEKTPR